MPGFAQASYSSARMLKCSSPSAHVVQLLVPSLRPLIYPFQLSLAFRAFRALLFGSTPFDTCLYIRQRSVGDLPSRPPSRPAARLVCLP